MVTVRNTRGGSRLGCLGTVIVVVLLIWFGSRIIPPWLDYQQYRDAMRESARFAVTLPDSVIRSRLNIQADSLDLPPEARHIVIRRTGGRFPTITISAEYFEPINLPIFGLKHWHFKPRAQEPL